ncbi:MAG: hypothetical protein M3126_05645 [Candidatus Eremiobacteraeota bacterium]|nr:hypothetical protein [Candidatus Eremiobacteraeota bacterium]
MRPKFGIVCGLVCAGLLFGVPADSAARQITILNRGGEPIFWVSIGHAETRVWSADMLPFNDVIDIGEAKAVSVPAGKECVYDLRARYGDGDAVDVAKVDICSVSSVSFDH